MIGPAMGARLLEGAQEVYLLAAGMARHWLWYVTYQLDGHNHARVDPPPAPARRR
jgi:hypothetical protein